MRQEKEAIKKRLNDELQHVKFTQHQEVLNRTHPVSAKEKLATFWNKEIEIPLVPVFAIFSLLIFSWGMGMEQKQQNHSISRQLVEVGGNVYWEDELERVVVLREN
ncbi:hypothetical protein SAMN05192533_107144 [Mesobacillus persicus]|uniref:Uncharacterized protein n=1 Tax=Mesobacillus persicus TaxID=930146 RepID=A0A1H8CLK9_9BACI|nr:hypothetical protein [Mesobacillus persicus]SEM95856.1 hypothetical protein SAMN05192533_107144 [Mesobacillus persicus]